MPVRPANARPANALSLTGEMLFGIVFSGALVWGILSPAAARACRSEISKGFVDKVS
jgi:hypothetical protein